MSRLGFQMSYNKLKTKSLLCFSLKTHGDVQIKSVRINYSTFTEQTSLSLKMNVWNHKWTILINRFSHTYCQPSVFPSLAVCVKLKETFHNVTENMECWNWKKCDLKQAANVIVSSTFCIHSSLKKGKQKECLFKMNTWFSRQKWQLCGAFFHSSCLYCRFSPSVLSLHHKTKIYRFKIDCNNFCECRIKNKHLKCLIQ